MGHAPSDQGQEKRFSLETGDLLIEWSDEDESSISCIGLIINIEKDEAYEFKNIKVLWSGSEENASWESSHALYVFENRWKQGWLTVQERKRK